MNGTGREAIRMFPARFLACVVMAALAVSATDTATAGLGKQPPATIARQFYQAWHANSRKAALKIAGKEAVDKLFGVRWRAMAFKGCNQRDEGGFECVYADAKADFSLAMIVDGGASVGGYAVASVSFSSEE